MIGRIRQVALACSLVALLGAAKPRSRHEDFPIPPIPPEHPPLDQSAPVPDNSLSAPIEQTPDGARLRPDFFNQKAYNKGQGYVPGSTIEGQQEQRLKPIPGINFKMPLQ